MMLVHSVKPCDWYTVFYLGALWYSIITWAPEAASREAVGAFRSFFLGL